MGELLVFVELQGGVISNTSKGAFTVAKSVAEAKGLSISALIAGFEIESLAQECFHYGANKVYLYDHEELKHYRCMPFTRIMLQTINDINPEVIFYGYSTASTDFAPRVSSTLKLGLLTGATKIEWDGDNLSAVKPIYQEKLSMNFLLKGNPKMIILGVGAFSATKPDSSKSGELVKCSPSFESGDLSEVVLATELIEKTVDLSEAKLIVSGGRGVGSKEKFQVVFDTAEALGGAVASTRAVWDAGWLENDVHVGQTGQIVASDIYIAAGISGAVQHTAGMKKSKTIIVINTDSDAPIWSVGHFGIVGDLHKVLPLIIQKLKE
ncbi:MAG: electron transfer flavoprotein subunit alpha/FixB family protein [Candidatus Hodarchaeales archaeon]|jgi:electron transfer flavoprotein alpha subunit